MKSKKSVKVLDQRQSGRELVFATIRAREQIARIDIAAQTNISAATVTSITAELIEEGLIQEVAGHREGEQKRGRPRVDLKVCGSAHLLAGLKFANDKVTVAIIDFVGKPIGDYEVKLPKASFGVEEFIKTTQEILEEAAKNCGIEVSDLSGVGVGLAGIIDGRKGFVHWSPQLTVRNVNLKGALSRATELPIFIDNDANLVAMAEQWFGYGRNVSDFVVLTIENGVGMGIVIDNEIYRGTRGCGAEFGHTKVALDGALCRCGQRGCLEAYLGEYALLDQAGIEIDPNDVDASNAQLLTFFERAKNGDAEAERIFKQAGRMFAMGLANIVNIFDPALIILSGERMQIEYLYEEAVMEQMRELVVQVDSAPPEVRIHAWGDLMWARGAAAFAMDGISTAALRRLA